MTTEDQKRPGPRAMHRLPYVLWTCAFLGAAFLLLRLVLFATGGDEYSFPNGWQFLDPLGMVFSHGEQLYWTVAIHLLLTVCFVTTGIWRARDANWPIWSGAMMVIPVIRLFIFVALAVAPGKREVAEARLLRSSFLERILPTSKWGSAVASILISITLMLPMVLINVRWLEDYGLALFIGLPFMIGVISAFLFGFRHKQRVAASMGVAALALTFAFLMVFVVALEGAVCILMSLPIAYPVALAGALVGHALANGPVKHSNAVTAMFMAVPGLMAIESSVHPSLPLHSVTTRVHVQAPAQRIWDSMIDFSRIEEPLGPIFKAGISYPTEARIEGKGIGAIRYCQFNTGPFVEPITTWNEPHLLAFAVREQPPPMVELSVYDHIDAPHVKGFFQSQRGEIRIVEKAPGFCMLEGTTWYTHDIWPNWYWNAWSTEILHRIHLRVLDHIKLLSEAPDPGTKPDHQPSAPAISGLQ